MSKNNKLCSKCGLEKPLVDFMGCVYRVKKDKEIYQERRFCSLCTPKPSAKTTYERNKTIGNKARYDLILINRKEKSMNNHKETWFKRWDKRIKTAVTDLHAAQRHLKNHSHKDPLVKAYIATTLGVLAKADKAMNTVRHLENYNKTGVMARVLENWSEERRIGDTVPSDAWIPLISVEDVAIIESAYKALIHLSNRIPRCVLVPAKMVYSTIPTAKEKANSAQLSKEAAEGLRRQEELNAMRKATSRVSAGRHNKILAEWPASKKAAGMKKKKDVKPKWADIEPKIHAADTNVAGLADSLRALKDIEESL